jgi:polyisoprenoid-binding protein YceI
MRISIWKVSGTLTGGMLVLAVLLTAAPRPPVFQGTQIAAHEVVLALDADRTKVHWTVDSTLHEVHGTFAVKRGTVHFDPDSGKAGGEIVVLATSGDSGNGSRDQRMHREILETEKYPDAVFRPEQIKGKVMVAGKSDVELEGVISLHGGDHEITVPVHLQMDGEHWTGTAKFAVPFIQWGIKNPSNWMLKVKPVVNVDVEMSGTAKNAI